MTTKSPSIETRIAQGTLSRMHFPALDGLRALAILLVIPHNVNILHVSSSSVFFPAVVVAHAGWIGVQLFFVLSGFLITGSLLDSQREKDYYASFFWRRALRILPLYYAALFVALVIWPMLAAVPPQLEATRHNGVWYWTFLSNWVQPFGIDVYGFAHFWSLAVEEQFYLLWPFIVRKRSPQSLIWLCGFVVLAALLARSVMDMLHVPHEALYMLTVCRMDALALGAAAAAALRVPEIRAFLQKNLTQIALVALILLGFNALVSNLYSAFDDIEQTVGYLFLAISYAMLMFPAVLTAQGLLRKGYRILAWRPLRLIGRYSYAMYVFHFPLHIFVGEPLLARLGHPPGVLVSLTYATAMVIVSFALGALSYHCFERHFLKFKNRWFGAPAPSPSVQVS